MAAATTRKALKALAILTLLVTFSSSHSTAQLVAIPDVYCFQAGQTLTDNVLLNDEGFQSTNPPTVLEEGSNECFRIGQNGQILWNTDSFGDCCGVHTLYYFLVGSGIPGGSNMTSVEITVKCDKPNCDLIDLSSYVLPPDPGIQMPLPCINVCAEAEVTLFVPWNVNDTYTWNVLSGGTGVVGDNPATYIVNWDTPGQGFLSLNINGTEVLICIDILPAPVASFTSSGYACLNQCLQFTNSSANASSYYWDFGDGNSSDIKNPCHFYTAPGIYIVTLTATNRNEDGQGNALCCCTDSVSMEIEIDELPGPAIYWVSTLCEGDESCYWTDATNCTNYTWTVLDGDGTDITAGIAGQGTDSICLTWGSGPVGTITLAVAGCDSAYCSNPTTVLVPIIPSISVIDGPIVVCAFSNETYTLPKWLSTTYNWTVTGGAPSGAGTGHVEAINWGPPGAGTIQVNYGSDFLDCLPGHEAGDCAGVAYLDVLILPSFDVVNNGPGTLCVGNTSSISATSSPLSTYNWSVIPAHPFAGQGTSNISINWTTPGTYIIAAEPTDTISYCNAKESVVVKVVNVPQPLGITGPIEICPGDAFYYTAQAAAPGFGFSWTVINGVLSATSGATVEVTWAAAGPYVLAVAHVLTGTPFCSGPPFSLTVNPKGPNGPYTIQGGPACLNSLTSYNLVPNSLIPPPHPDINITWSLSDPTKGSIVGGQGSSSVQIQWGNIPGSFQLIASAELCGVVVTTQFNINLTPKPNPIISQVGLLCPLGNSVSLTVNPAFASYSWSPGGGITQTINTSTPGTASVTVTDANGCTATAFHQVVTQPGPVAQIYSDQGNVICIQAPTSITMFGQTNPNYVFTWYCIPPSSAPILVQGPSATPSFTHNPQGAGTYVYYFIVTDTSNPGCSKQSPNYVINEILCEGSGPGCVPEDYTLTGSFSPSTPYCDIITFSYVASPSFTFTGWTFGDGGGSASASPTNTYAAVGCYNARVCGTVPTLDSLDDPATTCTVCFDVPVCVPVKARLSVNNPSCGVFNFTNLSTFLPGNGPLTYLWSANDILSQTSTATNPTFTFTPQAPVTVTLTATTPSGCQSQVSIVVIPNSLGIPVITAPASVCMNEAFNFSVNAPSAVTYSWIFGGSGTFGAQAGQFAYASPPTIAGVNPVSVTVTDAIGCVATASTTIVVHPAVPPAQITAAPDLVICQGATTALSAPAGYTYLWSPGNQTTQTISVGAGTYSVTITDANGCSRDLDQVEVVELPLPLASISGNLYICDAGCVILSAPLEAGHTYQWLDDALLPILGATGYQFQVCDFALLPAYSVMVTDLNGCSNTAGPVTVQVAASPSFAVSAAPVPSCAGQLNTLTVTPVQSNVNYHWSTGANATSIVVSQAGTYTVVGTDSISGCSSSASATVHPLPDLCIVPEGCYDLCPPKTICGPAGLDYQWNLNGSAITGETDSCFTILTSGNYSLTATNNFGCTTTSGQLIINIIDCPSTVCDSLSIDFDYLVNAVGEVDSCCVSLSYTNILGGIKGLNIFTNDGDLDINSGTIHPSLTTQSITANAISLASTVAGGPIPSGVLADFITFCVQNATVSPQVIFIEWIDFENEAVCLDSIVLHCPVEPDCIYVVNDTIECAPDGIFHTFTVCNPAAAAYPIGYIHILPFTPSGIVVTPPFIDITGSPLLPGNCASFTVQLSGIGIEGQTYCYNLVGHEFNPIENPATLCCSLDTLYCIDICDPCSFVMVEAAIPSEGDGCCFDIFLVNDFVPGYFDEIALCMLSPATTLTINNPFGSGWTTAGYTGTEVSFLPDGPGFVPNGVFSLPQICLQTNAPPSQLLEIKWMKDGEVVCRDTVSLFCEPPCGYIVQESVLCDAGTWTYQGQITNTSNQVINEAYISFNSPAGLGIYNVTVPLGVLNPGATSAPFNFGLGAPAMPGDTVCFTVTLHNVSSNGTTLECCAFEHCIVLPDCDTQEDCICDETFFEMVDAGFVVTQITSLDYLFSPTAFSYFGDCDVIVWTWGHSISPGTTYGPGEITHTFPGRGLYHVCMTVYRTLPDGSQCKHMFCKYIKMVRGLPDILMEPITVYPNPNNGSFSLRIDADWNSPVHVSIQDNSGRVVDERIQSDKPLDNNINFQLTNLSPGLYILRIQFEDQEYSRKFVLQ